MKIRQGFVSNSSSSSFLVAISTTKNSEGFCAKDLFDLKFSKDIKQGSNVGTEIWNRRSFLEEAPKGIKAGKEFIQILEKIKQNPEFVKALTILEDCNRKLHDKPIQDAYEKRGYRHPVFSYYYYFNELSSDNKVDYAISRIRSEIKSLEAKMKEAQQQLEILNTLDSGMSVVEFDIDNMVRTDFEQLVERTNTIVIDSIHN